MPPDRDAILRAEEAARHTIIVHDPTDTQKIGSFTIICTLLNRMIGELNPHRLTALFTLLTCLPPQAPAFLFPQPLFSGAQAVLVRRFAYGHWEQLRQYQGYWYGWSWGCQFLNSDLRMKLLLLKLLPMKSTTRGCWFAFLEMEEKKTM